MQQRGPGLLLRDIQKETPQVLSAASTIARAGPDILILQGFDYDAQNQAAKAYVDLLGSKGLWLPHHYAPSPNSGEPTGFDIDGDGQSYGPRDAQGYGRFPGQSGILILSRFPILEDQIQDFTKRLWTEVAPETPLAKLIPDEARSIQRLSSVASLAVPLEVAPNQVIWLLTHHATPPVFDGPEDRNGYRNADENLFWLNYLDGRYGTLPADTFVLAGVFNLDPKRGEGHQSVMTQILEDERLQDPFLNWPEEDVHTARFNSAGPLRLSYILPAHDVVVLGQGMSQDITHSDIRTESRHRLLWVDIEIPVD